MDKEFATIGFVKQMLEVQDKAYRSSLQIMLEDVKGEIRSLRKDYEEIKSSISFVSARLDTFDNTFKSTESELMKIRQVTKQIEMDIEDGVEDLARNIEYLENQSRRNNVKIFGIPEDDDEKSWDDTESKVKEAIKNKLGIEDEIKIERAHRIGKRSTDDGKQQNSWHGTRSNGPRPIVAKIDSWKVKERIVKKAREVKPDGLKFYSDFSQRTLDRRRSQIPALQAARNQGKDAFFVVDRLVIRNKRNDWHGHRGSQWNSTPNEEPGDAANSSAENEVFFNTVSSDKS